MGREKDGKSGRGAQELKEWRQNLKKRCPRPTTLQTSNIGDKRALFNGNKGFQDIGGFMMAAAIVITQRLRLPGADQR